MTGRLPDAYEAHVAAAGLVPDDRQRAVAAQLDPLASALCVSETRGPMRWLRPAPRPAARSVYVWGDVGRGKSMLMDLLCRAVPDDGKARLHFHDFMQQVHGALHSARADGAADPLKAAAERVTRGLRFLALDEVEVIDIVDAMILGRVFEAFRASGLVLCLTSNRHPDDLYRDGLKRELFLPFVRLIERDFDVIHLGGGDDYRMTPDTGSDRYLVGPEGTARLDAIWRGMAARDPPLDLPGRVTLPRRVCTTLGTTARASFDTLCQQPLGTATYLALANKVDTLLIDRLPRIPARQADAARRLMLLIDVLYDNRVRLIASAEAEPAEIFPDAAEVVEFGRAASRLHEMRAATWPPADRIAVSR